MQRVFEIAQALSPLSSAQLNLKSTPTPQQDGGKRPNSNDASPCATHHIPTDKRIEGSGSPGDTNDPPSSPFVADLVDRRSPSPVKPRSPRKAQSPKRALVHEAREISPSKCSDRTFMSVEGDHAGLAEAVQLAEADDSVIFHDALERDEGMTMHEDTGFAGMDDTAFSTFSAVPNVDMTEFAHAGAARSDEPMNSPAKQLRMEQYARSSNGPAGDNMTPRVGHSHPDPNFSPSSPTPRRLRGTLDGGDTTNLILDFTEQFNAVATSIHTRVSPSRPGRNRSQAQSERGVTLSPSKRGLPSATPADRRGFANLLDFEITPAPTPRSLPTITVRELESLKSEYLSQISSLKAGLSGKEAEIKSLKDAIGDAERRVGVAQEEVRAQRGAREGLEADRDGWERRGREMESVMRNVKEEMIRRDREKDELVGKLEETERRREEAETKAAEAESRVAGMRAGSASTPDANGTNGANSGEVGVAVEKVARELHALYKSKHETKVAALKKSYEGRWEKRVKELERQVEEANKENEELRIGKDATMSGVVPGTLIPGALQASPTDRGREVQDVEEQKAKICGLEEEVASVRRDHQHILRELEQERVEKGDLVAAVEEMLAMSAAANAGDVEASNDLANLRGSISRASGIMAPRFSSSIGSGESKVGRIPVHSGRSQARTRNGSDAEAPRGGGIMSNIERMGRGRIE
ncbi:MAG: hypothetical protein M1838_004395 [Thelocarpon superellum]|nr:MAG: hypothetical protein M1838_004395 [Thelocarpon superellum]